MAVTNIDDLLMGGKNATQPETPEYQEPDEQIEEIEHDDSGLSEDENKTNYDEKYEENDYDNEEEEKKPREVEQDEYGNTQEPENEAIRERLSRQAKKHETELNALRQQLLQQNAAPVVQQAAKDFEYDPNASGDWKQQLASFVKQTVHSMNEEQTQSVNREKEQQIQREFESNFGNGMQKFEDFSEVVGSQPIDDAMTMALRGMNDPAAFIYAASKRQPQELERISKLRDPYARMVEMGKLEERMRKNKPVTKAPRPIERTPNDSGMQNNKDKIKKDLTGDDLLAKADAKRITNFKSRTGKR